MSDQPDPPRQLDQTRLAAARLRAADTQPFLATALYALSPVADPGRGTFAVDRRWRLYVDPVALDEWTIEENAGVLLHEVGHMVRDHAGRAEASMVGDETAVVWNFAADAEINDDLIHDGAVLPESPVLPATLGEPTGKAAEYYYHRLLRGVRDLPPPIDCGPGSHGRRADDEERAVAAGIVLPEGLDEAETMLLRRRIAEEVVRLGRGRGSIGAGWTRWAEALLRPQVDWRRLLDSAIRGALAAVAGSSDYSYRRPSRRRVRGVVLPAMQRPLPRIAIVIDTSGSVDEGMLGVAWSEAQGCLRSLGVRRDLLHLYATDMDAHRIAPSHGRTIALPGGGGTDMRVGIATALAHRPKPDLVVVITDGETPWPERPPATPVVVALLEDPRWPAPDWARTIRIPDGQEPAGATQARSGSVRG
ncbi:MAG: vWA domain-containing protein [Acidimicrobiales bacterium]